jgi:hypothetical protein
MKKIINTHNKRLTFPTLDFTIEPNEIKDVLESDFIQMIPYPCIREVISETQKTIEKENTKKVVKTNKKQ